MPKMTARNRKTVNSKTTKRKVTNRKTTPRVRENQETAHGKRTNRKTAWRMNESSFREQIFDSLTRLRIPLSIEDFDAIVASAEKEQLSHLEFLTRFLSGPARERRERSIQRRIDEAKFPTAATLESFDWTFNQKTIPRAPFEQLATGDFLERQESIAFVGKSGTGKSHLIQGIGRACCVLGYRVRYTTSASCWRTCPPRREITRLPAGFVTMVDSTS